MSTSSIFAGNVPQPIFSKAPSRGSGFMGRVLNAIVHAREVQAQREVDRYLSRQPDRMLKDIGLGDGEIAELRARHLI